jgi:peptidoglycan/xylan/chitin deacetylase (PgdA/CDA1 family)
VSPSNDPVWKWEFPRIEAITNHVRAGRDLTPANWPGDTRVAVALSFDVDAESYSLYTGNVSPQQLSRGDYGPRVGLPRILRVLAKYQVPASFFIPAVSAQLHPAAIELILNSPLKHEIGLHGWIHERITAHPPEEERELTHRSFDWWSRRLGRKPGGIRTPAWDFSPVTLNIIRELGLLYDSSLMGDDRPYEILAEGEPTGVVELPVEWILDDYAYYGFDWSTYSYHRVSDQDVFEIYKAEFDVAYDERTLFLLTMHPFVTGHRSRILVLDRLVEYMQSKTGVWFATHEQIAEVAARQLTFSG